MNNITQIKTEATDGYDAVQVCYQPKKVKNLNQAIIGHCKKAKVEPAKSFKEFRLNNANELGDLALGGEILVNIFNKGQFVDVTAISKGKGFAGVIKRHNFNSQDATHGNSVSHNVPGSIGQRQTPGRVFRGKKMAGHLGDVQCTIQNLQIIDIDEAQKLILVKGAIPGAKNGFAVIKPAVKKD
jgi:large subunit ribosomal protein L3